MKKKQTYSVRLSGGPCDGRIIEVTDTHKDYCVAVDVAVDGRIIRSVTYRYMRQMPELYYCCG